MNIDYFSFDTVHLLGDSATHPIEPLATRPGSLLRLAGISPQRCRAYPSDKLHDMAAELDPIFERIARDAVGG